MKFLIATPAPRGSTKGNRITALRWSRIIRGLGHRVAITDSFDPAQSAQRADCLIALHAVRSSTAIAAFRQRNPTRPIILCLTGTDIHRDIQGERGVKNKNLATASLKTADYVLLIEPNCKTKLPTDFHHKTRVIYQSADRLRKQPPPLKNCFEVTVLGHLREVKDPFRTALAARKLPASSRIQIKHLGGAYTATFETKARKESERNSRYTWLGERSHGQAVRLLARSRLTVLTSRLEGGPSVFAEAIMNDVPILSTRITAAEGMLGHDYPGLFPVCDTSALTELLHRAETETKFFRKLNTAIGNLKRRYHPAAERQAWSDLIDEL